MEPVTVAVVVAALVCATTVAGLALRRRRPRVRHDAATETVTAADLATDSTPVLGERGTLVQFSTEFCARCPGVHRLLGSIAGRVQGLEHVDVDLTHRRDLVERFRVRQTPTVLLLDAAGVPRGRIDGAPSRAVVEAEIDRLLERTP